MPREYCTNWSSSTWSPMWSDVDMMERLSRINKKDNRALNKVITTCNWDDDLVLSKDDFTLMEKFLALFKPIKDFKNHIDGLRRTK